MSLYNDLTTVLTPYANKIKQNESDAKTVKDSLFYGYSDVTPPYDWGTFSGGIGETISISTSDRFKYCVLDVSEGEQYHLNTKMYQQAAVSYVAILCDADGIVIDKFGRIAPSTSNYETDITIPAGVALMYVRAYAYNVSGIIIKVEKYITKVEKNSDDIQTIDSKIVDVTDAVYGAVETIPEFSSYYKGKRSGNTGDLGSDDGNTLIRRTAIWDYILTADATDTALVAFLYTNTGTYIGVWNTDKKTAEKTNSYTLANHLDFEEIRNAYPSCIINIEYIKSGVGSTIDYPLENVTYTARSLPYEYVEENIQFGDWKNGLYDRGSGSIGNSTTALRYLHYVPDYWQRIRTSKYMMIAVYDSTGTYVGSLLNKGSLYSRTSSSDLYIREVDFAFLRRAYPDHKFKITINDVGYGTASYSDVSDGLGTIVIDRAKRDASIIQESQYHIPNRFTRETLYTETVDNVSHLSNQGMCTDGTYLYVATLQDYYPYIRKIDLQGNLIDTKRLSENIGHCNDMAYNPNDGYIYVVYHETYGARVYRLSTETLDVVDYIDASTLLENINSRCGSSSTQFNRIAYYDAGYFKVFLLGFGSGVAICNLSLTHVYKVLRHDYNSSRLGQGVFPFERYIYLIYAASDYDLDVMDWEGNIITQFNIPLGLGSGYSEVESVCAIDGVWYWLYNVAPSAVRITKSVPIGYKDIPVATPKKMNLSI